MRQTSLLISSSPTPWHTTSYTHSRMSYKSATVVVEVGEVVASDLMDDVMVEDDNKDKEEGKHNIAAETEEEHEKQGRTSVKSFPVIKIFILLRHLIETDPKLQKPTKLAFYLLQITIRTLLLACIIPCQDSIGKNGQFIHLADPNGPMIYKGIYHFFYQYNPTGAIWIQNITWGHSISTDLINWTPLPIAMWPSEPYDIKGCWSGSVTMLRGNKPVILYTGIASNNNQVQNLALPKNFSDPYLVEWVKSPKNPLMTPTPGNNIDGEWFRDPSTAWINEDGYWRVTIGIIRNRTGLALLYKSKDFINWIEAPQPLHSKEDTGMWECIDFYPVSMSRNKGLDTSTTGSGIKHVLKSSMFDVLHDYYTIGTYDSDTDTFKPDTDFTTEHSGLRYDYGKLYASKTFFDSATKRRILWGWANESTDTATDIVRGWAGIQTIPRSVWLDKTGKQLIQWPIVEIEKLRTNKFHLQDELLQGESVLEVPGVTGSQADVEISFSIPNFDKAEILDPSWTNPQVLCSHKGTSVGGGIGPFGLLLLASSDVQEYTAVFFRVFRNETRYVVLMCNDLTKSSMSFDYDKPTYGAFLDVNPAKEDLTLRSLVDHSIVESFGGNGKVCITARVYPTSAIDSEAHLNAFNNGEQDVKISSLNAWSMKKAEIS